jgi:hypothetical protein
MPHHKIYLPEPDHLTKEAAEAAEPWKPQGVMIQWGPYGECDGSPAVGIGTGHFVETEEDIARINKGGGVLKDMMMLWFNRSDINGTIRTLRRARNAAYGLDE